jgi:hypothetical protein
MLCLIIYNRLIKQIKDCVKSIDWKKPIYVSYLFSLYTYILFERKLETSY